MHLEIFCQVIKEAAEIKPADRRAEIKTLKGEVKKLKAPDKREKLIRELAGKPLTPGQYARYSALGAGVGGVGHVLEKAIREGRKFKLKARPLISSMAGTALVSAAFPAGRRLLDIEAAKRGQF